MIVEIKRSAHHVLMYPSRMIQSRKLESSPARRFFAAVRFPDP